MKTGEQTYQNVELYPCTDYGHVDGLATRRRHLTAGLCHILTSQRYECMQCFHKKRVTRGLNIEKYANSSGIGRITADAKRANNMTTRKRKGTRKREQEERKKTSSKRTSLCVSICLTIRRSGEVYLLIAVLREAQLSPQPLGIVFRFPIIN